MNIGEIPEDQLKAELDRREQARKAARCDYCGRKPQSSPCKYPERHRRGMDDNKPADK